MNTFLESKPVCVRISCPNKIHATSGCTCCWHCDVCKAMGCDNMAGFTQKMEMRTIVCDGKGKNHFILGSVAASGSGGNVVRISSFNFEQWLQKHTYWENIESALLFIPRSELGGVCIISYDGSKYVEGASLEEACKNWTEKYKEYFHEE